MLEQPAGSTISFRLSSGSGPLRVRGQVTPASIPSGRGTVEIRASLRAAGDDVELWRGRQRYVAGKAFPRRLELDLTHHAGGDLELRLEAGTGVVGHVHWHDLRLELPEGTSTHLGPDALAKEPQAGPTAAGTPAAPSFSILTPVHNPPLHVLAETIDSVLAQTYTDWELCLVDDGSSDPAVTAALERAAADPRIHLRRHEEAGGISAATNAALEMAQGEFIALLDHDDVLVPDALATVAAILADEPEIDMFYSDEELLDESGPNHVFAKPHWSPELLRSQMYTCHLGVYRRALAEEVGGFRTGFDGSQDFDFALRFTEKTQRVRHIQQILYRWRVHAGSSAGSTQAKPEAYPAARRALADHLRRTDTAGDVYFGPWQGIYRVVYQLPAGIKVAVVADASSSPRLAAAVADTGRSGVGNVDLISPPSGAAFTGNVGAADVVVLSGGDVEPLTHGWLSRLSAFALQPGVAAVGARTLAPDGRVEDGALTIEDGLPIPLLFGSAAGDPGPLGVGLLPANAGAVSGVVAIATASLKRTGGLDLAFADLAVADYCLRALVGGERVVSSPDVLVRRQGPAPTNDLELLARFRGRWATTFATDPYLDQAAARGELEVAASSG